jgi:anti-sigma factor RsiW
MAYQGGDLSAWPARKVARHMDRCSKCRAELDRMKQEVGQFLELRTPLTVKVPQIDAGFADLLGNIREWQSTRREAIRPKIHEHIKAQIETFFGSQVAQSVRNAGSEKEDVPAVLSSVEPLFSAFLGQKAAALLTSGAFEGVDLGGDPGAEGAP